MHDEPHRQPQHPVAQLSQHSITALIPALAPAVRAAIDLNDQARARSQEIHDIAAHDYLAPEGDASS
ncbi:MAG: hypothetical protein QM756_27170 [Polyangiaceae bacterium]